MPASPERQGLSTSIERFLDYCTNVRRLSRLTIDGYRTDLSQFTDLLKNPKKTYSQNRPIRLRYNCQQSELFYRNCKKKDRCWSYWQKLVTV